MATRKKSTLLAQGKVRRLDGRAGPGGSGSTPRPRAAQRTR